MNEWGMVEWSRARQITNVMGIRDKDPSAPAPTVTPPQYFASLVADERQADAIRFLAHALPRYEAIQWAARAMTALKPNSERDIEEVRAFDLAHQWLRDPAEPLRRACQAQVAQMEDASAEKFLLQAIFMSGGSITPEDLPPVHPAPDITAKMVAGAVLLTALTTPDPAAAMIQALEDGEKLAQKAA